MSKSILLVHGRHYKPAKNDLQKLWFDALKFGVERDRPDKLQALGDAKLELVYYGDISNEFLSRVFDEGAPDDLADRKAALEDLKRYKKSQFTKANYKKVPGHNAWMEAAADLFAGALNLVGLSDNIIESVAPDVQEYWADYQFGSDVRAVFTAALVKALKRNGDVCVIAHSLGTMISYDVFWKLSYYSEYRGQSWNRNIDTWITLGSPLADETVKDNLKGANRKEADQFPRNVDHWLNIAAEDDYISHDQTVAGDFRAMKRLGYVQSIKDKRIYNLAVRREDPNDPNSELKSNPHHGVGYLIHPAVSEAVANWL